MSSRWSTAAKVAAAKEAHPERYCPTDRCLWMTGGGHCPRHGGPPKGSQKISREVTDVTTSTSESSRATGGAGEGPSSVSPVAESCNRCGFRPHAPGANWGTLNGPTSSNYCQHVNEMRRCSSCSTYWWRKGQGEGEWDMDGCEHKDCPECSECAVCCKPVPDSDRLPFGDGVAHAACSLRASLFRSTDFGEARVFADAVALLTPTDGGGR